MSVIKKHILDDSIELYKKLRLNWCIAYELEEMMLKRFEGMEYYNTITEQSKFIFRLKEMFINTDFSKVKYDFKYYYYDSDLLMELTENEYADYIDTFINSSDVASHIVMKILSEELFISKLEDYIVLLDDDFYDGMLDIQETAKDTAPLIVAKIKERGD